MINQLTQHKSIEVVNIASEILVIIKERIINDVFELKGNIYDLNVKMGDLKSDLLNSCTILQNLSNGTSFLSKKRKLIRIFF